MTYCIGHKDVFFLCCGSPLPFFEVLIDHGIYFLNRTSYFLKFKKLSSTLGEHMPRLNFNAQTDTEHFDLADE